jgi:hypothetical protein
MREYVLPSSWDCEGERGVEKSWIASRRTTIWFAVRPLMSSVLGLKSCSR